MGGAYTGGDMVIAQREPPTAGERKVPVAFGTQLAYR